MRAFFPTDDAAYAMLSLAFLATPFSLQLDNLYDAAFWQVDR